MLTSVIATDYNKVAYVQQTRNDEFTDSWKWWIIIFLCLKKAYERGKEKRKTTQNV